jgi:hypothetical protein
MEMSIPQIDPRHLLPLYQDHLEEAQKVQVQNLLKRGEAVTNFDVQRVLFGGKLNKECGMAIKRYLLQLVNEGTVIATGQKRGRRYQWKASQKNQNN